MRHEQLWQRKSVAKRYARRHGLMPPESVILSQLAPCYRGRPILDIGVGAGRTTAALLELSRDYIGVDYSAEMIVECQTLFPDVAFAQCDARDLSRFGNGQFAIVMFSYNGIDCVDHEGRLRVLAEVHRVLADDGVFVFSSHNRDSPVSPATDLRNLPLTPNPLRLASRSLRYLRGIVNHWHMKKRELHLPEYSMKNDATGNYSVLTYHITAKSQLAQLSRAGFSSVELFDDRGIAISPDATSDSTWIYYVARKQAH